MSESVAQAPKEEEVVDFVIESRSPRKSIDLPDRSEVTYTSPSKTPPTSSTCAPGKLKMRWLQKQQQENVAPVIVSQSAQMVSTLLNSPAFRFSTSITSACKLTSITS